MKPKDKTVSGKSPGKASGSLLWRSGSYAVMILVAVTAGGVMMNLLQDYVQRRAVIRPPQGQVVLVDRPQWMPRVLADQIASQVCPDFYRDLDVKPDAAPEKIVSAYEKLLALLNPKTNKSLDAPRRLLEVKEAYAVLSDPGRRRMYEMGWLNPELSEIIYKRAARNPWIRDISHVVARPSTDGKTLQIEVSAVYRQARARVQMEGDYAFIAADGTRLPAQQVPRYRVTSNRGGGRTQVEDYVGLSDVPPNAQPQPIYYMTLYGAKAPAPAVGERWPGQDIVDGLRLVELVQSRPYANQISVVDIRNHGGRSDPRQPHLRMWAQVGRGRATDIRFGQFPRYEGDYLVPPQHKLAQIDDWVRRNNGRLAGTREWLDARYDRLHVSLN